jgi:hypothetical protein
MDRPRFSNLFIINTNGVKEEVMVYFGLVDNSPLIVERIDGSQEVVQAKDFWDMNPIPVRSKGEY